MYNNEVKDGKQVGFWLIDDKGAKQPVYHLLHDFLAQAKTYTADFQKSHNRPPTEAEYRQKALSLLASPTRLP